MRVIKNWFLLFRFYRDESGMKTVHYTGKGSVRNWKLKVEMIEETWKTTKTLSYMYTKLIFFILKLWKNFYANCLICFDGSLLSLSLSVASSICAEFLLCVLIFLFSQNKIQDILMKKWKYFTLYLSSIRLLKIWIVKIILKNSIYLHKRRRPLHSYKKNLDS